MSDQSQSPRRYLVHLALALLAVGSASAIAPKAWAPGDKAPLVRGYEFTGVRSSVNWADHRLTVVNFWATWCEPCREEMPVLQRLQDELGDQGLKVMGPMLDSVSAAEALKFVEDHQIRYTTLRASAKTEQTWGVTVFPTTFLVDGDGTILRRYVGMTQASLAGLERDIRDALAGRELQPMIMPDDSGSESDADRLRRKRETEHRH